MNYDRLKPRKPTVQGRADSNLADKNEIDAVLSLKFKPGIRGAPEGDLVSRAGAGTVEERTATTVTKELGAIRDI